MPNKLKETKEISFASVNEWRAHFFNNALISILEPHDIDSSDASDLSEMLWERIRMQPAKTNAVQTKRSAQKNP